MKEIKMKQTKQQKSYEICSNCHNLLIFGSVKTPKGQMCPHCLTILDNKVNGK
jgi:uncharacterized paraquat-inducible protein A